MMIRAILALCLMSTAAQAQLAISANDGKVSLKDGVMVVNPDPEPDTLTFFSFHDGAPSATGSLTVPASVVGPPQSVAIAPDKSIALVTAATRIDPADPTKLAPSDVLTVIDLRYRKIAQSLTAGLGASGVSINPAGTLALVANRAEGTMSLFTIAGKRLTPAGKIALGDAKSGPSHVIFTPDGKTALVTRDGDHKISVLVVNGTTVTDTGHDISAGIRPYGIVMRPEGDYAFVANIGATPGDAATVSTIALSPSPPRVVDTLSVGPTPEGLALSSDGTLLAVTVMNGSNQPAATPFFHDFGLLKIYRVTGGALALVTEAKIGHWCQGVAWEPQTRTVMVQCMAENVVQVFWFKNTSLTDGGAIPVDGPAALAVAP